MENLHDGHFELNLTVPQSEEENREERMDSDEETVVISGISGVFPNSANIEELERNLRNKLNLISSEKYSSLGVGKIPDVEKFDASYFGLKSDLADAMDPMGRLLLEKTYETIVDSGYNPQSLKRSNVGVFIGLYLSETEAAFFSGGSADGLMITGIGRCFLANRISYCFGFHGPSFCVDTACSSGMHALHLACRAIRSGDCDSAIVGGCNLCLNNGITLHLQKLGVVSLDGAAKVLDEAGNGYCRAETVCTIFLQKRKHARRIYASVIHTKVNCDGYKAEGITYPSSVMQKQLLSDFYRECNVEPCNVSWLELHATGTRAGDREEIKSVSVLCENRASALKVGSIRSNMGHAEAASTLCSIAKVIIAMRSGLIPPNINYRTPRNDIEALHNGQIQVITENTRWDGGLVAINSFGLGGSNGHALLQSFEKSKINAGLPQDALPRVVPISGRTRDAVDIFLTRLANDPIDDEFTSLLHEIHSEDIVQHLYRGAIILSKDSNEALFKEISHCPTRQRPLWLVFAGMGCQWAGMGKSLMQLPIFAESISLCDRVLRPHNVDLVRIISDEDERLLENVINCFVAITAMQIAFVDVLRALNVNVAGMVGHSAGEIACAYADNCLSREQTILCAYYRGLSCMQTQTELTNGAMAAIGLGYEELKNVLADDIDIACCNSARNCTISGPTEKVDHAVNDFRAKNVFARRINSLNMAFHSRYVKQVAPKLVRYLRKLIPEPRVRSNKWVSSSVSKYDQRDDNAAAKYCSAEYLSNNLQNTVLFDEASRAIAEDAIVIEASPHSLLRAVLKQTFPPNAAAPLTSYISLGVKNCDDSLRYLLTSVAKLFLLGETLKFRNLYPLVEYPVSKETPMIAPLVRWQHDRDWNVVFTRKEDLVPGERRYVYNAKITELAYMFDHIIDGRNIVPGYVYLLPLWETVPLMHGKVLKDTSIVFEKLRFQRMVNVYRDKPLSVLVHIQKGSGNFEIVESNQVVLSGRVYVPDDIEQETIALCTQSSLEHAGDLVLDQEDIYKEFLLRGYDYRNLFRQMLRSNFDGTRARVKWNDNWVTFLDTISQTYILQTDTRYPCLLTGIDKIVIDLNKHNAVVNDYQYQREGVPVHVDKKLDIVEAAGVQIRGLKGHVIPRRKLQKEPRLLVYKFVSYATDCKTEMDKSCLFSFYASLIWRNIFSTNYKIVEYQCSYSENVHHSRELCNALNSYPHKQANAVIIIMASETAIATATPLQDDGDVGDDAPNSSPLDDGDDVFVKLTRAENETDKTLANAAHLLIAELDNQLRDKIKCLADEGFLMIRCRCRGEEECGKELSLDDFVVCCEHRLHDEKLFLLRRNVAISKTTPMTPPPPLCLKITQTFEWLEPLKEAVKNEEDDREIILYAESDPFTGALGLYNCLIKETTRKNIKCFIMLDQDATPFSLDHPFYQRQIRKNFLVNVYKNGRWGCYAHWPIGTIAPVSTSHAFANVGVTGDLSTLNWYQADEPVDAVVARKGITQHNDEDDVVDTAYIRVHYSALNFKDVLLATGVLSYEAFVPNRLIQECLIGCEFSGTDDRGNRYMGMYPAGAICTTLLARLDFTWRIPDEWSLEEAATVPVAYLTVVAAFFVHGNLKRGESVLIHSGAGGVGQAAINIATRYECEIFTTVGTAEKREFIKKAFPHIKDSHIGKSRDTSFEQMVMRLTDGRGVDMVLNSLAEDKLLASVRCLAKGGRFLEIGKLDLLKDNPLGMNVFLRGISFHCVLLDKIYEEKRETRDRIVDIFQQELKSGSVKPIVRTVFNADQVESAFRYMSSGKHIGKVLIKIRGAREDETMQMEAVPRFNCSDKKVYIICGGLGGMGLELADWLVLRGARKVVLTSRLGLTNGYQRLRIQRWKSYGVMVVIRKGDITNANHVQQLLRDAENFGSVDAIFNLAAIIDDGLIENQNISTFERVSAPKKTATRLLDEFSRKICRRLRHFVVFSTLSGAYGNPAQTNYSFANSACERICETRKEQGLPALAIQWGVIGDVGLMTRMDMEKTCTLVGLKPQPIRCCLKILDIFLNQSETIVSSFILDDKSCDANKRSVNLQDIVANILGIKDMKSVSMYSPLPELGMDSINGLEVKQTLEQQYDLFLSPRELMSLTFASLQEIQKTGKKAASLKKDDTNVMTSIPYLRNVLLNKAKKQNPLEEAALVVRLPSMVTHSHGSRTVFCFPPIDGIADAMKSLSENLLRQVLCFQYVALKQGLSLVEQAEIFASRIIEKLDSNEPYNIVAYSYGVIIAMETLKILQSSRPNRTGKLVLIDGSMEYAKILKNMYFGDYNQPTQIQTKVILDITASFQPSFNRNVIENDLNQLDDWESKLDYITNKICSNEIECRVVRFITNYLYHCFTSMIEYHFETTQKFHVQAVIIKARKMVVPMSADSGLDQYFTSTPEEHYVDENHFTILRSKKVAEIIEKFL